MQTKHSAIREYSDHLITFQSGFPHVSHQSLQDRGQGSAVRDVQNPTSQEPWRKPTGLLQDSVLEAPAQRYGLKDHEKGQLTGESQCSGHIQGRRVPMGRDGLHEPCHTLAGQMESPLERGPGNFSPPFSCMPIPLKDVLNSLACHYIEFLCSW